MKSEPVNKKWYVAGAGVICLGLLFVKYGMPYFERTTTPVKPADGLTIIIQEDGFTPSTLTVTSGSTVKFVNSDKYWHWPASDPHPSHTFYSELDPKAPVKPGDTWSVILTKTGTWGIHDHLSPYITGTITVK